MRLVSTILVLVFWISAFFFLQNRWQERRQTFLDENRILLDSTYRASVSMYHLATETFVKQVIQRPDVIATFRSGQQENASRRSAARGQLYRMLSPAYQHLNQQGIDQLQFHTAAGNSFLRFHAPDKFNDPLQEIRPGIRRVIDEKKPLFGFEIGRMNLGFRYIFPLFDGDEYIGSVETSATFKAISQEMKSLEPEHEYHLVLRKSAINRSLFPEQQILYREATVNANFLTEDHRLHLPVSPPPPPVKINHINEHLHGVPAVQSGMNSGKPFSVPVSNEDGHWIVSFVPANDISGNNVAYVIAYTSAPFIGTMSHYLIQNFTIVTLIAIGIYILSLRLYSAHRNLRLEKKHLQTVTDTIGDGLYVLDTRGIVIQVNPAFCEILGYQEHEVTGQIGHYLFHVHGSGRELPVSECPIITATSNGDDFIGEEVFRHKEGHLLTVELTCKPIIREEVIIGSVTAFRDISERKAAEQRLLESDRIKSEFIATASHELRTPLTVIQGYTELLRNDTSLAPEQIRDFETIVYDKAVALERIVDDLLDVSRIESGRPLCLDVLNLNIVAEIRQVIAGFEKEVTDRDFVINLPNNQVNLSVDRFKIHQALENLINNAIKFSQPGTKITIETTIRDGFFVTSIADQGVGIAPDKIDYIFDKFFRIDNSDTAVSGFGLGLYLVKQIIEAHHGKIRVENRSEGGTRFTFSLPLKTPRAPSLQ